MNKLIEDAYLGDGVYASFDGYAICLDLRGQDKSRIVLGPTELAALDVYRREIGKAIERMEGKEGT